MAYRGCGPHAPESLVLLRMPVGHICTTGEGNSLIAGDLGLQHHRAQRLVDALARLEDQREERPRPQRGYAPLNVTRPDRQDPWSGPVSSPLSRMRIVS